MPAMLAYVLKPKDAGQVKLKEQIGYLQFGDVMVRPTAAVKDPLFLTHLMSVGGAGFLASDYVVVRAADLPALVKAVQKELDGAAYVLHGHPTSHEGRHQQTLLEWDPAIAVRRGRQALGTFIAEHCSSAKAEDPGRYLQQESEVGLGRDSRLDLLVTLAAIFLSN
jgi:hypothetical protein